MRPNRIFHGNEKPTNAVEGDCWYRDGELLVFKNDWERCVDIDESVVIKNKDSEITFSGTKIEIKAQSITGV